MIQDIIDTGLVQWGASKEEAKVIRGGDQPWTRRVIAVSTCPQVGSIFSRSRTPPNPRDAFAKALGAISPTLDRQGTVC